MEEQPKYQAIATLFSDLLKALNITPYQLAKDIGIDTQKIYNYIAGNNKPSYEVFALIAATYPNIDAKWLLTGEGQPFPKGRYNEKPTDSSTSAGADLQEAKEEQPLTVSHSVSRLTAEERAVYWESEAARQQREIAAKEETIELQREVIEDLRADKSWYRQEFEKKPLASLDAAAPQPHFASCAASPTTTRLIGPRFDEPVVLDFYTGERKAA